MKQKLSKLFILFIVMSVLTSSSKDSGTSKTKQAATTCPGAISADNSSASFTQAVLVSDKDADDRMAALADNEISLSPISRFILVQ